MHACGEKGWEFGLARSQHCGLEALRLAVPRLSGNAGDFAPSFRRQRFRSRLSSLAASQTPQRYGCLIFRLLLFVAIDRFARGDVHDMLGKLVRIAGAGA